MTLIKFNQIAQASGKMNGTIFSKNSSGQYMKTLQKPINKRSALQDNQRTIMASLTKKWGLLTEVQRNGWADLALQLPKMNRVGVLVLRSGFNVFIEFNINLRSIDVSTIMEDAPSKPTFVYEINDVSLIGDLNTQLLALDVILTEELPDDTSYFYIIRTTGIISQGRKSIGGIKKILKVLTGVDENETTSANIQDEFIAKYGRFPTISESIGITAQLVLADFPCTNLQKVSFLSIS